jgi:small-conductance mechanosensitive channel
MASAPATSPSGAGRALGFLTASTARELGILLCLSVMFPFMVHVIPVPDVGRLGAMLLPMFYAPLLAALLARHRSALMVAALAPWLNWALTSHPAPLGAVALTIELVAFVLAMRALLARAGARWFLAAPAYLACMAAAALGAAAVPVLIGGRGSLAWALECVSTGLPGIAILVLINWLVLRCYPPGGGDGPRLA